MASQGNKNAVGNSGGKSLQDRQLAAEVRILALNEIKDVLTNQKGTKLYSDILSRLAGSVLPRLNEVTGENGGPMNVNVVSYGNNYPVPLPAAPLPAPTS